MKIVYFYQYFSTPKGAWGTRVYEFARKWVQEGHDVTVVTSVYSKSDLKADRFLETQEFEGIKVKVINVKIDNKQGALKRIRTWFEFMFFSCWYALVLPADVVVASSGPITVGVPGLVARYLRGRKFVFETRDMWPQVPVDMGLLRNRHLIRMAYWFEKRCYRAASHVVALSPGMVKEIVSRYPDVRVTSVTNSANMELFGTPSAFDTGVWKERKYAIYTGNIGAINNSQWLLDAAVELSGRGRDDIHILLVGDGPMKDGLLEQAAAAGIGNFTIGGLMPKTDLTAFIQGAMASLVPLKGHRILDSSSPNKFFESLAAGIPVIQNTQGWMKEFLGDNEVGFTLDPDDAGGLADLLIKMADGEVDIKRMGDKARHIAARDFDKDVLAMKMLDVLDSVADKKRI